MSGRWDDPGVVRGFSTAAANEVLLAFVRQELARRPGLRMTEAELTGELLRAGFEKDPPGSLTEYNRPIPGHTLTRGDPVIYEGTFRAVRRS